METTNLPYGITYVPTGGVLAGIRCCVQRTYGYAKLFATYPEAEQYIAGAFGPAYSASCKVRIEPASRCVAMIPPMVEFFTGRRRIQYDAHGIARLLVVNENRPTFDQVWKYIEGSQDRFEAAIKARRPKKPPTVIKKIRPPVNATPEADGTQAS